MEQDNSKSKPVEYDGLFYALNLIKKTAILSRENRDIERLKGQMRRVRTTDFVVSEQKFGDNMEYSWFNITYKGETYRSESKPEAIYPRVCVSPLVDLIIPSKIYHDGAEYTVIGVSDSAFQFCHAISSVEFVSSDCFLSSYAFSGCSNLKKLIVRNFIDTPRFEGVFNGAPLADIEWYGDLDKMRFFLNSLIENEYSAYHPTADIKIHIKKNSQIREFHTTYTNDNGNKVVLSVIGDLDRK